VEIHKEDTITVGSEPRDGRTVLFVRDDGAGFNPAAAGRMFGLCQRFHTLSEFEGTGLGLALVRRIISRHGGTVWADGTTGGGATFYLELP